MVANDSDGRGGLLTGASGSMGPCSRRYVSQFNNNDGKGTLKDIGWAGSLHLLAQAFPDLNPECFYRMESIFMVFLRSLDTSG